MKTILNTYNKVYLGSLEITQDSLCIGSDKVGVLHKVGPFRELGHYETGDAVLWDNTGQLFKVCPPENITLLDTERYTPTGVIAIPSSHDVYGTGEAGVVALMSASLTTPDTGEARNVGICWGGYGTAYPLLCYTRICTVGIGSGIRGDNAIVNNTLTTVPVTESFLPSDAFEAGSKHTKAIDETYYSNDGSNWNNCIPSPYLNDGSRNPTYYSTLYPIPKMNVLSDFAGKDNTNVLCQQSTSQPDWKTAASITNSSDDGYYPAACTCWRYCTVGTSLGDWYLPACGELGYVCCRKKIINETIDMLLLYFNITLWQLNSESYNSSSLYSEDTAWHIYFPSGRTTLNGKNLMYYRVRPFTRLK